MSELPLPSAVADAAAAPIRKPRLLRLWAVVLIPLMLVLLAVIAPWFIDGWVRGLIISGLERAGLDLDPSSRLSVSVFGGRLHGEDVVLRARGEGHEVAAIRTLDLDLAVLDSLSSGDVVIESLVAAGMTGNLEKRGTWSPIPGDDAPPEEPGTPIDWATWYRRAADAWKKHQDKQKHEAEEAKRNPDIATKPPVPASAPGWPRSVRYHPAPPPAGSGRRVLIRRLDISGGALATPHATPIKIVGFSLTGTSLASRWKEGERSTCDGRLRTANAGELSFSWSDGTDGQGSFTTSAAGVPLALLGDPSLGGPAFAAWGATGSAKAAVDLTWKQSALSGRVDSVLDGLALSPTPQAPAAAPELAKALTRLKGRPIAWPVRIGGTTSDPEILDSGLETATKHILTEAAKAEAEERLGQLKERGLSELDKHLPGASASAAQVLKGLDGGALSASTATQALKGLGTSGATNATQVLKGLGGARPGGSATAGGALKDRLKLPTLGR